MDLSNNIYDKNRISFIVSKRREKYFNKPTEIFFNNVKGTCYIIVGLIIMYIGMSVIITSICK